MFVYQMLKKVVCLYPYHSLPGDDVRSSADFDGKNWETIVFVDPGSKPKESCGNARRPGATGEKKQSTGTGRGFLVDKFFENK